MNTKLFEELGLTKSEVTVFLTLLKIGSSKAGKIIDDSGLQNPVVHRAFHSLIEKGFVTYSVEGKIKYYQAIDPRLLLNILDEKKRRLEELMPKLLKLNESNTREAKAVIHCGIRGIRRLFTYILETGDKEFLTYGAPEKSLDLLGSFFWTGFHKKRIKKGIKARMIFHESLKERAKELNKLRSTEIRLTEKGFEELTETVICGDKVAILIYLDRPIGVLIEERLAANSYKKFFEPLWENCKKA